jgi:hypothetical protein
MVDFSGGTYELPSLLGNGDGTFQPAVEYEAGSPPAVTVGDFNGDGLVDLAGSSVAILLAGPRRWRLPAGRPVQWERPRYHRW